MEHTFLKVILEITSQISIAINRFLKLMIIKSLNTIQAQLKHKALIETIKVTHLVLQREQIISYKIETAALNHRVKVIKARLGKRLSVLEIKL